MQAIIFSLVLEPLFFLGYDHHPLSTLCFGLLHEPSVLIGQGRTCILLFHSLKIIEKFSRNTALLTTHKFAHYLTKNPNTSLVIHSVIEFVLCLLLSLPPSHPPRDVSRLSLFPLTAQAYQVGSATSP